MKKAIIIAVSLLTIFNSCTKKNDSTTTNPTNNNNNNQTTNPPNSITLHLNNTDYTIKGASRVFTNRDGAWPIVTGVPGKTTSYSFLQFEVGPTTGTVDYNFSAYVADGPLNGLGSFTVEATGSIKENFSGGEDYDITGGTATVTQNDNNALVGTMVIHAKNAADSITVNGSFNITDLKY